MNKLQNQNNKDQIRKYLLQNPLTHQYNVNISGANERSSNLLSLMYESDRDGFKENKKDKLMVNYRTDVKLSKRLDFNFSGMVQYNKIKNSGINASSLPRYASFANYTSPSFGAAIGSIKELSPYDMLVNEDGTRTQLSGNFYVPILETPSSHGISRAPRYSGYCSLFLLFVYVTITLSRQPSQTVRLKIKNTKCSPNPERISSLGLASSAFARHYLRNLG